MGQKVINDVTVVLRTQIPPNEQDSSLMQANRTNDCTNPAALDPEEMECRCYEQLKQAGGEQHGLANQAKCIQCQICKSSSTWQPPLCADWKNAVCTNACQDQRLQSFLAENIGRKPELADNKVSRGHEGLDNSVHGKCFT